eukprot:GHVO01014234.1.p1 GENE.GHVO01014234.1~~GHVO01014234.1.p1  ORF type:complete len:123 (-),score=10.30 GHVO01014234.1:143-511(-)
MKNQLSSNGDLGYYVPQGAVEVPEGSPMRLGMEPPYSRIYVRTFESLFPQIFNYASSAGVGDNYGVAQRGVDNLVDDHSAYTSSVPHMSHDIPIAIGDMRDIKKQPRQVKKKNKAKDSGRCC